MAKIRSFARFLVLFLAFAVLSCHPSATPNLKTPSAYPPCLVTTLSPPLELCRDIGRGPACTARLNFARSIIRGTVTVVTMRYDANGGDTVRGTGAIIDARGTVLTAYHVIRDQLGILAEPREITADWQVVHHRRIPMDVVALDAASDTALIAPRFGEALPPPLEVDRAPLAPGLRVWQFGSTTQWSFGTVQAINLTVSDIRPIVHVSNFVDHGDSGGPLIDERGRVRGLLSMLKTADHSAYFAPVGPALRTLRYQPR